MRLADRVAIITGAGSGIGRASAYLFSKEGAKIVVADVNDGGGIDTANNIKLGGGDALFVHTDVCVASEVDNLVKRAMEAFGKIDILFNNAGIEQKPGPIEDFDESSWDRLYAVNVKGVFLGSKYAVPYMKKAKSGVIINTASGAGTRPLMHMCAYSSSKGAVITLTKGLALELASSNIRVNCIRPTMINTPMIRPMSKEDVNAGLRSIPLGHMGSPEDVAYAALYLASDESAMLTGSCINVDGGRLI